MDDQTISTDYRYSSATHSHAHAYLLGPVESILNNYLENKEGAHDLRLFDLGCGNGSVANHFSQLGWEVTGVDPSIEGIAVGQKNYPHLKLAEGSAYDDLSRKYGTFPVVISLEVIEHVYAPRAFAKRLFDLVEPGGIAIVSTPYHGYLKNLALAVTGKLDNHFTVLWDHGHIKFWSMRTLEILLNEVGFSDTKFDRVGRIPPLAKSMIATAVKPSL